MKNYTDHLGIFGLLPICVIPTVKDAAPLMQAIRNGGLDMAEIVLRSPDAVEQIREAVKAEPDMIIGAGTVLTVEQMNEALDAGAKYIVTPSFNRKVLAECLRRDILCVPGCQTAAEIEEAMFLGLKAVKIFPAETMGGVDYVNTMASIYPKMRFLVTGGITTENFDGYLKLPNVLAAGGSYLVPPVKIKTGDFEGISALIRSCMAKTLGFTWNGKALELQTPNPARARSYLQYLGFNPDATFDAVIHA